jgi:hypothetical protein
MDNREPDYQTPGQMYERLREVVRAKRSTGLRVAAAEAFLEPKNPFDSARFRRAKPALAAAIAVVFAFAAVFLWFGFVK